MTREDYRGQLIHQADAMIGDGSISMLYVIGPAFTGFGLEAMGDNSMFGLRHWRDFKRIAVASDLAQMARTRSKKRRPMHYATFSANFAG